MMNAAGTLPIGAEVAPASRVKDRVAAWVVFLALASIHLAAMAHHLPWHDEHQAWLIARSLGSASDLWQAMRLEGHPPLWHILLTAAQRVSDDLVVLKITQSVIAVAALGLIAFTAPFPVIVRALVGANYFILYEYGIIARSYGLGMLLILAALATWRTRLTWLFLGLVALTSLHFLLLAGAIGVLRLARGDRDLAGVSVFAVCCCVSALFIWPNGDVVRPILDKTAMEVAVRTALFSGHALFPLTSIGGWFAGLPHELSGVASVAAGLATLPVLILLFRDDRIERDLCVVFFCGLTLMAVVVYPMFPRHAGTLVLLVLAMFWIRGLDGRPVDRGFAVFAGWLAAVGIVAVLVSGSRPFSGSHLAARAIAAGSGAGVSVGGYPAWYAIDLAAVLGRPVVNVQRACLQTYVRWNYPVHETMADGLLAARLGDLAARSGGLFHFVTNYDLDRLARTGLDIGVIAHLPEDAVGARMRIYRVRSALRSQDVISDCR